MHSRQVAVLNERLPDGSTEYLVVPDNTWDARLGAPAQTTATAPPLKQALVTKIDDRDAGFVLDDVGKKDWKAVNTAAAYRGRYYYNNPGKVGDKATWTFSGVENCDYEVFVTYPRNASYATLAPFTIYDGGVALSQVNVNQRLTPAGPIFDGVPWQSLGVFRIASGTLRVTVTDAANGYFAADAVRIRDRKNIVQLVSVERRLDEQAMTVSVTVAPPPP
jgi:hypothetical protein